MNQTKDKMCSRYILVKDGIETSVNPLKCICNKDTVMYEFQCPYTKCGVVKKTITEPSKRCYIHKEKEPIMMICGGPVEMCDDCINNGYRAIYDSGNLKYTLSSSINNNDNNITTHFGEKHTCQ